MNRGRQYGVLVSLLLPCSVVVACSDEPIRAAPVFLNGATTRPAAAKPATSDARFVIVGAGQSLGGIAEANHVSKQAIIAANHLSAPYTLKIGQTLRLPVSVAEVPARSGIIRLIEDLVQCPRIRGDCRVSGRDHRDRHAGPQECQNLIAVPARAPGSAYPGHIRRVSGGKLRRPRDRRHRCNKR